MISLILFPRFHPLNRKSFPYYNIFSRDFCVYLYIFLRDFLYSYYIFPHDFSFLHKKFPDAIEIVDSIRGFFYIKPNNIFSRDFCIYFYIFLRDFLSKAIIKGDTDKTSTSQTASGGQLSYEASLLEARFGQFVFHGPAVPVGFTPFLSDFAGQVQAFRIGAEFFQVKGTVPILSAAI